MKIFYKFTKFFLKFWFFFKVLMYFLSAYLSQILFRIFPKVPSISAMFLIFFSQNFLISVRFAGNMPSAIPNIPEKFPASLFRRWPKGQTVSQKKISIHLLHFQGTNQQMEGLKILEFNYTPYSGGVQTVSSVLGRGFRFLLTLLGHCVRQIDMPKATLESALITNSVARFRLRRFLGW